MPLDFADRTEKTNQIHMFDILLSQELKENRIFQNSRCANQRESCSRPFQMIPLMTVMSENNNEILEKGSMDLWTIAKLDFLCSNRKKPHGREKPLRHFFDTKTFHFHRHCTTCMLQKDPSAMRTGKKFLLFYFFEGEIHPNYSFCSNICH